VLLIYNFVDPGTKFGANGLSLAAGALGTWPCSRDTNVFFWSNFWRLSSCRFSLLPSRNMSLRFILLSSAFTGLLAGSVASPKMSARDIDVPWVRLTHCLTGLRGKIFGAINVLWKFLEHSVDYNFHHCRQRTTLALK
jgi:hypothetical protein